MATPVTSREPGFKAFLVPGLPTLADVLLAIERDPTLAGRERANLASALRTVARAVGLPTLADVPAHPAFLRPRLTRVAPVALGIGQGHWANVRARLRKALGLAGVTTSPGRHRAPLSPAWREFRDKLPSRKLRCGLSRLMHHASAHGVEPALVDDAFIAAFRRALEQDGLLRHARRSGRQALTFWNRAVDEVPGWPLQRLAVPVRADRYGLSLSAFGPGLEPEVKAWLARLAGGDRFEELPFRPLRPETIKLRRQQVRGLASALVARGRDPRSIGSFADLVQPAAAKEALRFFLDRAPGREPTARMRNLVLVLIGIAKHWVRADQVCLDGLRALAVRCTPETSGMTAKNAATLRAFDDEDAVQRLVHLPRRLAGRVRPAVRLAPRDAHRLQTALMVDLLLAAPMRLRNLVALRLDEHVVRVGRNPGRVLLAIPAAQVKNRQELAYELPRATVALLDRYLAVARPVLASVPSPLLFPGAGGRPKSARTVEGQLGKATFAEVGVRLTPHQFRHVAGKLYLDRNPGGHEVVRALLGHSSIVTTIRFYAGMEQAAAVRHYDALLDRLRSPGSAGGRR